MESFDWKSYHLPDGLCTASYLFPEVGDSPPSSAFFIGDASPVASWTFP